MELIREFSAGEPIQAGAVARVSMVGGRELVMVDEVRCDAVGFALRRVVLRNLIVFEGCDPVRVELSGLRWAEGFELLIEVERTGLGPGSFRGGIYGRRYRPRPRDTESAG